MCWSMWTPPQPRASIPIDFAETGADMMSISAHKFGGSSRYRGLAGASRACVLVPHVGRCGDQERARRAGLENGAAIAGFAAACGVLQDGGLEQ